MGQRQRRLGQRRRRKRNVGKGGKGWGGKGWGKGDGGKGKSGAMKGKGKGKGKGKKGMSEFDYANDWSWWGTADWVSADYSAQGFNYLAPGHGGEFSWMRRLCPLTVKASPHIGSSPILPFHPLPTMLFFVFSYFILDYADLSPFTDFVEYFVLSHSIADHVDKTQCRRKCSNLCRWIQHDDQVDTCRAREQEKRFTLQSE